MVEPDVLLELEPVDEPRDGGDDPWLAARAEQGDLVLLDHWQANGVVVSLHRNPTIVHLRWGGDELALALVVQRLTPRQLSAGEQGVRPASRETGHRERGADLVGDRHRDDALVERDAHPRRRLELEAPDGWLRLSTGRSTPSAGSSNPSRRQCRCVTRRGVTATAPPRSITGRDGSPVPAGSGRSGGP